ncbi:MAG: hypothetical protein JWP59_2144 [Massilia sp.]|nr:hypothetical protein [Massilia sp.]
MKNITRKLMPIVAALGFAFASSAALAAPFNVLDGSGNVINAATNELDWSSSGSGLAINVGPFGTPLNVGDQFDFVYQANLAAFGGGVRAVPAGYQLDTGANGAPDSAFTQYEFTIVAKLREVVQTVTPNNQGGFTVTFGLASGPQSNNKVAIYYDTAQNANHDAGSGFDDGTQIALLTVVPEGSTSNFTSSLNEDDQLVGVGGTSLNAGKVEGSDYIDQAYLQGLVGMTFNMNFQSTLNYPAPEADRNVLAFHVGGDPMFEARVVDGNDILFKVDGFNSFGVTAAEVPEPTSVMLMGLGLMGLVGVTRRRKQVKG